MGTRASRSRSCGEGVTRKSGCAIEDRAKLFREVPPKAERVQGACQKPGISPRLWKIAARVPDPLGAVADDDQERSQRGPQAATKKRSLPAALNDLTGRAAPPAGRAVG